MICNNKCNLKNKVFNIMVLMTCIFLVANITSVSSQNEVAKIVSVAYPKPVPEARPFNLTVSIQNLGNTSEKFLVRIVYERLRLLSHSKEIIIPRNSIGNVTFKFGLLLSGDLVIEVVLHNQLIDFLSIFMEVPALEADVGLLMIELVQVEITVIGITLAALAIFASTYIQFRHKWEMYKVELIEKLKKQHNRRKNRKIMECTSFLLKGDYGECLSFFLEENSVRKALCKVFNLKKRKIVLSNYENTRKSTVSIAFILTIVTFFVSGVTFAGIYVIDAILFVYPTLGARDIVLSVIFFPVFTILLIGILSVIFSNYSQEFEKFHTRAILLCIIALSSGPIYIAITQSLFPVLLGSLIGLTLGSIHPIRVFIKKTRLPFRKESTEIKNIKEKIRKLHEKSSTEYEREKHNMMQEFEKQLGHFKFAFEVIGDSTASELREIEATYSFGLISEKRYKKSRRKYDFIAMNARSIISEISRAHEME